MDYCLLRQLENRICRLKLITKMKPTGILKTLLLQYDRIVNLQQHHNYRDSFIIIQNSIEICENEREKLVKILEISFFCNSSIYSLFLTDPSQSIAATTSSICYIS